MKELDFNEVIDTEHDASMDILRHKASEYASDDDRLENFKCAAGLLNTNPANALVGMLAKHFVSVGKMAKCPELYKFETWLEKLRDIRNYTYLLTAVLKDMEIK